VRPGTWPTPVNCSCGRSGRRRTRCHGGGTQDLLAGVYNHLATRLFEITQEALDAAGDDIGESARAGLAAFMGFMLDDPRYAQIVLVEVVGAVRHGLARLRG